MKLFPQKWMLPRDLRDGWERCRIGGGGTKALGRAGQRAPVPPAARLGHKEGERKKRSTVAFTSSTQGFALQIQCYQCEEFQLNNDCSSPEFIVNCTVNVQDMCQKEVMEQSAGIMYRKSCASSAACLIASAGYQSFCSPGKLNSVCISCCNTPLCNGPRPKKRSSSASALRPGLPTTILLLKLAFFLVHC
ncbi:ly6/PLAUR domain-containing protein 1 isoform X1 [Rhinolophus sinicus]|uniref:ly6/PLAUR domain-containing protein 1 isoform X1 n=1 Tax=Rhinolophus sinicus TaxID=89399 RepID=UPI000943FD16|nr:PREDICTED: ly6/PLAUR domain-containing protein 1 isoform X1 [Rhinolophus sinicus]